MTCKTSFRALGILTGGDNEAYMKVLNLQCSHSHSFEGWFSSEADFQDQLAAGLVECPMCGDHPTIKALIDYEEFCGLRNPGGPSTHAAA